MDLRAAGGLVACGARPAGDLAPCMLYKTLLALVLMVALSACTHVHPRRTGSPTARLLVLTGGQCASGAIPVSLDTKPTPLNEILKLFEQVSEMRITSETDLSAVTVEAHVSDVPWDCLLQDAANQLGLGVTISDGQVRLARKGRK